MRVCDIIKEQLYPESVSWLAERTKINYKSLCRKLNNDTFTAYELIKIGIALDLDLNEVMYQSQEVS